jgi:hypothetical protein
MPVSAPAGARLQVQQSEKPNKGDGLMTKFRRQTFGVFGACSVALAIGAVACGSNFNTEDCKASHTCAPSSAGAGDQPGGDTGSPASPSEGGAGGNSGALPAGGGEATEPLGGDAGAGGQGPVVARNPPPTVLSVSPGDAEQNIEPDATVTVTFSEPLTEATVDSSSVKLLAQGKEVAGTVAYADSKVTLTPEQPLALLGEYSISLSTDVTDVEGAPLAEAFESTFVVRDGKFYVTTAVEEDVRTVASTVPVESNGSVLLAWSDGGDGTDCPVLYQRFLRGTAVDSPQPLSMEGAGACGLVRAKATPNGLAAVAWAQEGGQHPKAAHVRQYRDGQWSTDETLGAGNDLVGLIDLGLASNGMVSLFENLEDATDAYRTDLTGDWAAQPDKLGATGNALSESAMAFDDAGNGLLLWRASKSNVEQISFSRFTTASGKWAAAALLPGSKAGSSGAGYERGVPALATDPQGNAVALWFAAEGKTTTTKLMASHYSPASSWAAPVPIGTTWSSAPIYDPPALVFDGETFVAAFSADVGQSKKTLVTRFDPATSEWSAPESRQGPADSSSSARMPKLATDGRGHLILVWATDVAVSSTFKFYYQRYANNAWGPTTPVPGGVIEDPHFAAKPAVGAPARSWSLTSNTDGLAALAWTNDAGSGLYPIRLASYY